MHEIKLETYRFVSQELSSTCVSVDGLQVYFEATFQYRITEENLYPVIIRYRDYYKWRDVVEAAGRSAVQHTCSEFFISNFQNKRGILQDRMFENLKHKLEGDEETGEKGVYAVAGSLQLNYLKLPKEVRRYWARMLVEIYRLSHMRC